jgi:hypothetical protein
MHAQPSAAAKNVAHRWAVPSNADLTDSQKNASAANNPPIAGKPDSSQRTSVNIRFGSKRSND